MCIAQTDIQPCMEMRYTSMQVLCSQYTLSIVDTCPVHVSTAVTLAVTLQ